MRVELGDTHTLVGIDHLLLNVRECGGLDEFLTLALGRLLGFVGFPFLLGNFAIGLGLHQFRGRGVMSPMSVSIACTS